MHSGCSNTIFAYDNFMVCIRIQLKSNMEQTPILYQGYARIVPYWTGLNVSVVRKMGLDITILGRRFLKLIHRIVAPTSRDISSSNGYVWSLDRNQSLENRLPDVSLIRCGRNANDP